VGARPAGLVPATALSGPGKGRTMRKGALTEEDREQERRDRIAYEAVERRLATGRASCHFCGRSLDQVTGRAMRLAGEWVAGCITLDCQTDE
jgi:hypothetical protein